MAGARSIEVDTSFARHLEMPGEFAQLETFELAAADIVMLRENPGIDEIAAVGVKAAVRDGALGYLQVRRTRIHHAAVESERELDAKIERAMFEVFEIRSKKIVPLDNVRIALGDDSHQLGEHRAFIHRVTANHVLEAAVV